VRGDLDLAHVDAAGEVEVAVEEVAVAVLLGGPAAHPPRPGQPAGARGVAEALGAVAHALVRGQRLLRDHVAHQAHQHVVGQARRGGAQLRQRLRERPGLLRRARQVVVRLPRGLHGRQQRQHVLRHPPVERPDGLHLLPRHLHAVRRRRSGGRGSGGSAPSGNIAYIYRIPFQHWRPIPRVCCGEEPDDGCSSDRRARAAPAGKGADEVHRRRRSRQALRRHC
jgi:hypothetical protein